MPNPIYETTASNSGKLTVEHHSQGQIHGLPGREPAGPPTDYIEIPNEGTTGPKVPEFPSKSAGVGTNDN